MKTQARAERTRERILNAALTEFARHGYDATGVAEICAAASVTKGAFYHHFAGKQALFLELLDTWLQAVDEQLQRANTATESFPLRLQSMAQAAQQVFVDAQGQVPMFLEFWAQAARDPTTWQATIAPYRRYRSWFAQIVAEGIADGSLRAVDPAAAAQVIVALAVGLLLQGLLDPEGADWGRAAEDGVQILLDGLRRRE
jgi:AcrR family transcriptional regulator